MDTSKPDPSLADAPAVQAALKRGVRELPPAPTAAVKLLQLTRDENTAVGSLARVIETEPALATKILRLVNSAYYGFDHRIASIRRAVTLLGFSAIRRIALQVLFFDRLFNRNSGGDFDLVYFWQHCLFVAVVSRKIGEQLKHPEPDSLYAAGLLHDMGKVVLESDGRLSYSDFLSLPQNDGSPAIECERNFFGIGHDQLGAFTGRHWNLPPVICRVQELHHADALPPDLPAAQALDVAIVSLADFTAWTQGIGSTTRHGNPELKPFVSKLLDPTTIDFSGILESADEEIRSIGAFYNFKFPNTPEIRGNLVRTAIELSRSTRPEQTTTQDGARQHPRFRASLTAPHRSLSPEEFIPATLSAVHDEFALGRVFMLRTAAEKRGFALQAAWPESALAEPNAPPDLDVHDLPRELIEHLRRREPMLLSAETKEHARLLSCFAARHAAIVPVTSNRRLVGLLWIDNQPDDAPVDAPTAQDMLAVANELGVALANSRMYEAEKRRAQVDALTGLFNRSAIDDFLQQAFARARTDQTPLTVGLIDIDHFKQFNDNFGHQAGDSVLRIVASTLRGLTRPSDFLGRYGGEEFIFVLPDTGTDGAERYAQRIRSEIERRGHVLSKRFTGHHLTVSVGFAIQEGRFPTPSALIAAADKAMYQAKHAGRNQVCAWSARD